MQPHPRMNVFDFLAVSRVYASMQLNVNVVPGYYEKTQPFRYPSNVNLSLAHLAFQTGGSYLPVHFTFYCKSFVYYCVSYCELLHTHILFRNILRTNKLLKICNLITHIYSRKHTQRAIKLKLNSSHS